MIASEKKSAWVCLGAVAGAHGVRGQMRVKTFTQNPLDIAAYGTLSDGAGRDFTITEAVADKIGARVTMHGIDSREQAAALKGTRLYIPRARLPALKEADDFYHADLTGLAAVNKAGETIGTCIGVHNFGAGDMLEIKKQDGSSELLSFTKENVPHIDIAAGRLEIHFPASTDAKKETQK